MKREWRSSTLYRLISVVLIGLSLAGCAGLAPMATNAMTGAGGGMFQRPGQAALVCSAGGALTGAALGGAIGGDWKGALIGAGVGALAGGTACFAIAEYKSRQVKSYEETQQDIGYTPAAGDVVQITEYAITPPATAPGSQTAFNAKYYVMTPDPNADVPIAETRIVKRYDQAAGGYKELGRSVNKVTVKPGTREADGKWDVKSGVAEGKYLVVLEVAKSERSDSKELPLTVTTNQALLNPPSQGVASVSAEGSKSPASAVASAPERPSVAAPARPVRPAMSGALASLGEPQPGAPTIAAATTPQIEQKPSSYFLASKVVGRGNVREGAGSAHRIVGEIQREERFLIVDRTSDADGAAVWYKIRLETGLEGWVAASLGEEVQE
jgi:Bacterial SH3 domain/Glycine zipper